MQMLSAKANQFGGMIVDSTQLPDDATSFTEALDYSLDGWRREGFKMIWIEIPYAKSEFIPIATSRGFLFHHTGETQVGENVPGADYLMLTLQLEEGAYVPPFATHYIGAGGVVLTPERELLVISERFREEGQPYFKLPGGALDPGEHLAHAAEREVYEETGVRTKFESVTSFHHKHDYSYGKSDIYFVCRLSPLSLDLNRDEGEIADVRWMPVDELLDGELMGAFNKIVVQAALERPGMKNMTIYGYPNPHNFENYMVLD